MRSTAHSFVWVTPVIGRRKGSLTQWVVTIGTCGGSSAVWPWGLKWGTRNGMAGDGPCGGGFTRVVVGQIKPDILRQICDDQGGRQLCRCATNTQ